MNTTLLPAQRKLLESLLSPTRLERLKRVLSRRLGCLTLVLDNLYDPHNMAAIVRTLESMGIQDLHVVQQQYPFNPSSSVTRYSHKWITTHKHADIATCFRALRQTGFKIYVADMDAEARHVTQLPLKSPQPIALVLGNEHKGVSNESRKLADGSVSIPMFGFTESYNVSVAAALLLQPAVTRRRGFIAPGTGSLSEERTNALYDSWLRKSVKNSARILKEYGDGRSG